MSSEAAARPTDAAPSSIGPTSTLLLRALAISTVLGMPSPLPSETKAELRDLLKALLEEALEL